MIQIYDIAGKVSAAIEQGTGLVHSLIYKESLGIQSGDIVTVEGLGMDGRPLGMLPVRLLAAWKLPWGIYSEGDWLHEQDLGISSPESKAYYLRWWGNLPKEQEILTLLLEPVKIPITAAPTI